MKIKRKQITETEVEISLPAYFYDKDSNSYYRIYEEGDIVKSDNFLLSKDKEGYGFFKNSYEKLYLAYKSFPQITQAEYYQAMSDFHKSFNETLEKEMELKQELINNNK